MEDFNLGTHTRPIATTSVDAQRWFDMGLNWCFGFNQEAGLACFLKALTFDSNCPMAHWGVAYACGPFYNLAWHEFGEEEAAATIQLAHRHLALAREHATDPAERGLVDALAGRFLEPQPVAAEAYAAWDNEYADRLRDLHQRYPDDHDIMALFVEALITRTVRRLFDVRTGLPAPGSAVVEALAVIERSISLANETGQPQHAAIHHLNIHALEMSNEPEKALPSADILATLCPDAGHLNHMPGHIYALCGQWQQAHEASNRAIRADDLYANVPGTPKINYYLIARCHDLHLQIFACMFLGKFTHALAAADKVRGMLTEDVLRVQGRPKLARMTEAYYSMRLHVLVRFGRWQDIVEEPMPSDPNLYLVTTAMQHYARGVAFASLKRIPEAEKERTAFAESLERIPATWRYNMNPAHAILAVGAAMLAGELAYHKGHYAEAFKHLREAVQRDDDLNYCEPWPWMHPPRHPLGALLAAQGYWAEAEEVYRDDLGLSDRVQRCAQHPGNVWALRGLVECLEQRDEQDQLPGLRQKLALALTRADVPIASSCMCRNGR
ncbi:hypothetical protein PT974_07763 [Cladobotryum mycophilum]|uniref:Uncharacterized protein n=1 Tax=Cladobotryum mycophilum TaxID=491253 RepID=A0ABR0SI81_9HYPO